MIAPPRTVVSFPSAGDGEEYRLFSEDLSRGAVQQFGQFEPLSFEASESTPYVRTDYLNGNVGEHCQSSCFQPLVTRADDTASPFQPFGEAGCTYYLCGPEFKGASSDLSHVIVRSRAQLTSTPLHIAEYEGLYEWSSGHLRLVSVFPPGEESRHGVSLAGTAHYGNSREVMGGRRAISENGERIIFGSAEGAGGLYLRDVAKSETVMIGEGGYMTASSDASRVFFLNGGNLDVFEVIGGEGEPLAGKVTDLTVDPHAFESANVVAVLGASDDGSYVYFAAAGALTPDSVPVPPGKCQYVPQNLEGCNVYVRHGGVTRLVAAGWDELGATSELSRVSPDGRWLAFMSRRSLTGYDNRDANSGEPDDEVYLYHAETSPAGALEPGKLVCASCNPTGARPVGVELPAKREGWAAANVPGLTHYEVFNHALYQSRYLSDSGRLFFESHDALVPQDVNGAGDVYEYEPEGVPAGEQACSPLSTSGSEVFKPAHVFEVGGVKGEEGAGCVALISSGTSSEESSFLDASETGGDVFFLTTSKLALQDFDTAPDVYDAHECTSESPCIPPLAAAPPCTTEASCKPSPTPQPSIYGLPSSATFSGPGNVTLTGAQTPSPASKTTKKTIKCKKGFSKRHNKCVKNKKKAKAKKANNDRRGK